MAPPRCAIIGVGQIGGSLGLMLRSKGITVTGVDPDGRTIARALELGAISEGGSEPSRVATADVVFLCAPLDRIVHVAESLYPHLLPGSLLTDVGSVKSAIVQSIERSKPPEVRFVGGHPMMGTEGQGIDVARADLCRGAAFLMTPTDATPPTAISELSELATQMEMRPVVLSPSEHDRALAEVSHLPFLLSVGLMNIATRTDCAGPTFRDMTRVAQSPSALWREILTQNHESVREALEALTDNLRQLLALEPDELERALVAAREAKRRMQEHRRGER